MQHGNRWDPYIDKEILETALELLVKRGYAGATIQDVAANSSVSRSSIYRRYSDANEMLVAAIHHGVTQREPEYSRNARLDLGTMFAIVTHIFLREFGARILGTVLAEETRHPDLLAAYRYKAVWPRRKLFRVVLERAVRRGEIKKDVDLDAVVGLLWGAAIAHYAWRTGREEGFVGGVMDVIWAGIPQDTPASMN